MQLQSSRFCPEAGGIHCTSGLPETVSIGLGNAIHAICLPRKKRQGLFRTQNRRSQTEYTVQTDDQSDALVFQ